MIIKETSAKAILSRSKVFDYALNPYTGCEHACSYCYARFMRRFTGHQEPWGEFLDVKTNAPDLLAVEIARKKRGTVWVSGVCDPYQPQEAHYRLTRRCLEILARNDWPVRVQSRSPLVLRDMDVLQATNDIEVGLTVTTADDRIRKRFERGAPAIGERLRALAALHTAGIRTFAMIAPLLPGAEGLAQRLAGHVDYVLIDRMNYTYGAWVYRKYGLEDQCTDRFFHESAARLAVECTSLGIPCRVVFEGR